MILCKNLLWILVLGTLCVAVRGNDMPPGPDPDLPQPFDPAVADGLLESSPFTRTLNLSDSLVLTGIAYVDGHAVATLVNRSTRETFLVSNEPNAMGWRLADANASTELKRTQVKINVGTETVVVRYGEAQLDPKSQQKGMVPGGGDAGGIRHHSSGSSGQYASMDGGTRVKTSSLLGAGGSDRYRALSEDARTKFKDIMDKRRAAVPNASTEELSAYAQKIFPKIEASDAKAQTKNAGAPTPTTASVTKVKRTK